MTTLTDVRKRIKQVQDIARDLGWSDEQRYRVIGKEIETMLEPKKRGRKMPSLDQDLAMDREVRRLMREAKGTKDGSKTDSGVYQAVADKFHLAHGREVRRRIKKRIDWMLG